MFILRLAKNFVCETHRIIIFRRIATAILNCGHDFFYNLFLLLSEVSVYFHWSKLSVT